MLLEIIKKSAPILGFGVFCLFLVCGHPFEANAAKKKSTIEYSGQMIGPSGESVSGVFHLKFAFHRDDSSARSVWKETHEVAVLNGQYNLRLGQRNPIPRTFKLKKLFVSVSLVGGPEIMRESLAVAFVKETENKPVQAKEPPLAAGRQAKASGSSAKGISDYADKAGFAIEAEHAISSDRLEGKNLEEVTDHVLKVSKRRKIRIGAGRKFGGHIGGHGGGAYEELCPRGYVVVGARGSSGMYIDGLQFICAPLEIE